MVQFRKAPVAVPVAASPLHPYHPPQAQIANYVPNTHEVATLLAIFAGGCAVIFGVTLGTVQVARQRMAVGDKAVLLWFVLCGFIHFFFEGYFAFNHTHMGPAMDTFGQLWKEYALSDSRYLTSDPFVLCMETVTAIFWGPLSFLLAALIVADHPLRHPLQAIVSLGQIYGDVLYFATAYFDHYYKNLSYSRPEAYYYWGYYVMMNMIWIIIPSYLLYTSSKLAMKAFQAQKRESHRIEAKGANGHANGLVKKNT